MFRSITLISMLTNGYLMAAFALVMAADGDYGGGSKTIAGSSSSYGPSSSSSSLSSLSDSLAKPKSTGSTNNAGSNQNNNKNGAKSYYGSQSSSSSSSSSKYMEPIFQMKMQDFESTGGRTVQAAVQTKHQIEFRDYPSTGQVIPTTIEVGASSVPLNILFRSASSNLNIQQAHDGAQGSLQETSSEDEPHRLIHSVKKPIIQEVHEVITPFRKITQEIQPVQEEILTIVARGSNVSNYEGGYETKGASISKTNSKQILSPKMIKMTNSGKDNASTIGPMTINGGSRMGGY